MFAMRLYLIICLTGLFAITGCTANKVQKEPPNIIYILADDLGYGDLGCYGQDRIKTPNIDKMASQGIQFNQHYAGSTVCAPSRSALISGRHLGNTTVRGNTEILMKDDDITIAKELKKLGYSTACIGKWGIGHPPPPDDPQRNGFDHFFGYLSMWHAHNYYPEFLWRNGNKVKLNNVVERPEDHYKPGQAELTGLASKKIDYAPDLFTDDALKFIEDQNSPFFLFLSYTIPHTNNEAEWFGTHGMEVPDLGEYKDKEWPDAEKAKAAMISRMDGYIGTIIEKLQELGIDEKTLVMFSSDNGPHQESGTDPYFFNSNGSLRGIKRDLYEGGIRVPAIAYWPKTIPPGTQTDLISAFWDVLPTFVDAAGGEIPSGIDGISFLPTLLGNKDQQKYHDYLYWEFHEGSSKQAVRMGKWKGVRLAPSVDTELYNLELDVEEKNNIASENPEIIRQIENIFMEARSNQERWPLRDNIKQVDTDLYKMK